MPQSSGAGAMAEESSHFTHVDAAGQAQMVYIVGRQDRGRRRVPRLGGTHPRGDGSSGRSDGGTFVDVWYVHGERALDVSRARVATWVVRWLRRARAGRVRLVAVGVALKGSCP